MLIQKLIILNKVNELRDILIEKIRSVYSTHSGSSGSASSSSSSGSGSSEPEIVTIKGIKASSEYSSDYSQKITEYFNDFITLLNSYLDRSNSNDLSEALGDVPVWAYGYEYRKRLVYEKPVDFSIPNNPSYSNIENLFFDFNKLININTEEFIQATEFTSTTSETRSSGPLEFLDNVLIENFKKEIQTLRNSEVKSLADLSEWLKHKSGGNFYLMNKFEDLGKILHFPDEKEMTKCIYYDTNLLKIIKYFNLKTYIPSSLRSVKLEDLL